MTETVYLLISLSVFKLKVYRNVLKITSNLWRFKMLNLLLRP